MVLSPYINILRPLHWTKNIFVFAPLFFGHQLFEADLFLQTLGMFLGFCLVSSAVYCLNDMADLETDKATPDKCVRPLASGALSLPAVMGMMGLCLLLASAIILFLCKWTGILWLAVPVVIYLFLNIAYSLWLKHHAIIDIACIALGFVLRILAGGLTTGIQVSHWIVIMTFLLTLFLALTKRVVEIEQGASLRKSITGYNKTFAYMSLSIIAAVIIVCYILYTLDRDVFTHVGTPYLYTTVIWVLVGLLRYLQLIIVLERKEGPTTLIIGDFCLMACFICWLLCFAIFIYLL